MNTPPKTCIEPMSVMIRRGTAPVNDFVFCQIYFGHLLFKVIIGQHRTCK